MKDEINTHQPGKERMSGGRASPDTGTTSRLIKEKLLKGCGKECDIINFVCDGHSEPDIVYCGETHTRINGVTTKSFLCPTCQAKLQQHEETSKAMNDKFDKILDELQKDYVISTQQVNQIKQRRKEE